MKMWWIVLYLFSAAFAKPIQERVIEKKAIQELASLLDLPQQTDLVAETQKRWLRKEGRERWDMIELAPQEREKVLEWADRQGLFSSCEPALSHYDTAFILGASTSGMQMRLEFLKELWEKGVRFEHIVWLTGERPLDGRVDQFTDRCKTETEVAQLLWEESPLPEEMRKCSVIFVNAETRPDGKRPTTEDTIKAYLAKAPEPCTALFVSSQPFCAYQFAILQTHLPKEFLFDVVGSEMKSGFVHAAAVILDTVARLLYQESVVAI